MGDPRGQPPKAAVTRRAPLPPPAEWRLDDAASWFHSISRADLPLRVITERSPLVARFRSHEGTGLRMARLSGIDHVLLKGLEPSRERATTPRIVLGLQVTGNGTLTQGDTTVSMAPGEAVFYDISRPFTLTFDASTCLNIHVPWRQAPSALQRRAMPASVATRLSGSIVETVTGAIASLEDQLGCLTPLPKQQAERTILDMVDVLWLHAVALSGSLGRDTKADDLQEVLEYIEAHLDDPDLDPQVVADAHFISIRTLQNLAAAGGLTIAGEIRRRRLERCRQDLSNPEFLRMSAAAIGARWGFAHPAHFGSLFHQQYGMTPAAYRASLLGASR